ncbi:MAG: epoxyqueuosine reductase [Candidatus Hydrogenedentota bacterium]|nr:MAG: epoxyqueuosine reductase [Candidatus Hydrogenedentota bacterium]
MFERPEKFLEEEIKRFVDSSEANRLTMIDNGRIFGEPLVGFANADDPIFAEYKKIIGGFHWHPRDLLQKCAKDENYEGSLERISVICWILPIVSETVKSNAGQTQFPSPRWAHTRDTGEKFNVLLRNRIVELLRGEGLAALAPMDSSYWQMVMDDRVGFASSWSERHAMYAAGLGTFSLNDGLITPRGIAHRCGSVVVSMKLEPTLRTYEDFRANCLFYNSSTCGDCIERCPAGALSESGHDKAKCGIYIHQQCIEGLREKYKIDVTTGCGLCQAGVPCSMRIPKRPSESKAG